MKKNIVILGLIFIWGNIVLSQTPPDTLWTRTFGGIYKDGANSIQPTEDGGFIIAGYTRSYGTGILDFWLIKTDENGNELWNQNYGGSEVELARSVQQTLDCGYIIAGYTTSYGAGNSDFFIIKTDENGNVEWDQTYGGSNDDGCKSVQQTSDGGYIAAGYTYSYGSGCEDVWLIKMDEDGNQQWAHTYGGSLSDGATSVQQISDSCYVIGGYTFSYGAGNADFWLIKVDESGNLLWNKTYGGNNMDVAKSFQQTSDDGFIIAGYTGTYEYDFYLIKTDENGNQQWAQTYGGSEDDCCYSVQQTSDNGYIMAGYTGTYGTGDADFWLIKTDENSNVEWDQTYGGNNDDLCRSVQQTSDGGYIAAGYTYSYGAGYDDVWLIRLESYSGVDEQTILMPELFNIYNSPNPFNKTTSINYYLPTSDNIKIQIYNLKAQLIETLVDVEKPAGYHSVAWNAEDMSNGIYFYKLSTKDKTFIKKIILMR